MPVSQNIAHKKTLVYLNIAEYVIETPVPSKIIISIIIPAFSLGVATFCFSGLVEKFKVQSRFPAERGVPIVRWFYCTYKQAGKGSSKVSVIDKPIQSLSLSNLFLVTGEVVNMRVCTVNKGHDLIRTIM